MTSTALPQGPTNPAGYQTGVPSTPASVSPGVVTTIVYPATSANGPMPTLLTWVVILNSSPYTLLVTSGANVTQIAAFTSDLVNVQTGPTPSLTVLPQLGAQLVSPGSDNTVYATWYEYKPAGQYPAALGSGSVATQVTTLLATGSGNLGTTPPAVPVTVSPNPIDPNSFFNVAGFGSIRFQIQETGGLGPLVYTFQWQAAGVATTIARRFVIPGGGFFSGSIPNWADMFRVIIANNQAASTNSFAYEFQAMLQAVGQFNGTVDGVVIQGGPTNIGNGATQSFFAGNPDPGPATLYILSDQHGGLGFTGALFADNLGQNTYPQPIASIAGGIAAPSVVISPVILPSTPVVLKITNGIGVAANFTFALVSDSYRVG